MWTAAGLVNELLQAHDEHRFHRFIRSALKHDLVVLDELGFIPFSPNGAQALFTFCSELYERGAMILTTNRNSILFSGILVEEPTAFCNSSAPNGGC